MTKFLLAAAVLLASSAAFAGDVEGGNLGGYGSNPGFPADIDGGSGFVGGGYVEPDEPTPDGPVLGDPGGLVDYDGGDFGGGGDPDGEPGAIEGGDYDWQRGQ